MIPAPVEHLGSLRKFGREGSSRLQRFQLPVSQAGGSVFLLVKPANRWGFVCSSRVRPFTAAKTKSLDGHSAGKCLTQDGQAAAACNAGSVTKALRSPRELAVIDGGRQ